MNGFSTRRKCNRLLYIDTTHAEHVRAIQCEIPITLPTKYITGIYALNVHGDQKTSGDWHDVFFWRDGVDKPRTVSIAGDGLEWNTNPIYEDYGIYKGKKFLLNKRLYIADDITEVYIANHFRAILDMLYLSLKKYGDVLNLTGAAYDWLDTDENKIILLKKAHMLNNVFNGKAKESLNAWINYESGSDWRNRII